MMVHSRNIINYILLPTAGAKKELPLLSRSLKILQRRIDSETKFNQRCYSGTVTISE